jgi:hypothetical protein
MEGGLGIIEAGHTFTGNRKQYDTTRSLYVGYGQVPDEISLSVLTPDNETYSEH